MTEKPIEESTGVTPVIISPLDNMRGVVQNETDDVNDKGDAGSTIDHNIDITEETHPREKKRIVGFLFFCFVLSQIFVNYDSGAIPSVLEEITNEFNLSGTLLGLLGALPYIGLIFACPLVGALLQLISQKRLLLISMSTNILSVIMLGLSFDVYVLYISRFLLGFTQSAFCIYVPVWVDEFAPEAYLTMWMGLIQGGTVFGICLGYLVTGYLEKWRVSIGIQGAVLFSLSTIFLFTPERFINLYTPPKVQSEKSLSSKKSVTKNQSSVYGDAESVPIIELTAGGSFGNVTLTKAGSSTFRDELYNPQGNIRKLATFQRLQTLKARSSDVHDREQESDSPFLVARNSIAKSVIASGGKTPQVPAATPINNSQKGAHSGRAPTFMAASPAGCVLETLEVAAGFDHPLVLRGTSERYDIEKPPVPSSSIKPKSGLAIAWTQFRLLFQSSIYIWTVFTLCALLFVVTGIQYWSTKYFIVAKGADEGYVRIVFSATAASAPTLGVFMGAFLIDRLGGYKTARGMYRSLWFCLVCGVFATGAGVVASFLDKFVAIISMMWVLLFFGGAILPPATGILIASVDPSIRPFASSFSMFSYNIFGYALGTFLPGPIMSHFGLDNGMKLIFFWSFLGVVGMSLALFSAWRNSIAPIQVSSSELMTLRTVCLNRTSEERCDSMMVPVSTEVYPNLIRYSSSPKDEA